MRVVTRKQQAIFHKLTKIAGDSALVVEALYRVPRAKRNATLDDVIDYIRERRWDWHGVQAPKRSGA